MPKYRVTLEAEIDAEDPKSAAIKALRGVLRGDRSLYSYGPEVLPPSNGENKSTYIVVRADEVLTAKIALEVPKP